MCRPEIVHRLAGCVGDVLVAQELHELLAGRLVQEIHHHANRLERHVVLRLVPVLAVGIAVADRRRLDLGVGRVREAAWRNSIVEVHRVVERHVEGVLGRHAENRSQTLGDATLDLVDLEVRIMRKDRGRRVVGARLVDERIDAVVGPHLEPHAAPFRVAGGELVTGLVGHRHVDLVSGFVHFPSRPQGCRLLQHAAGAENACRECGRVHFGRILGRHDQRHESVAAGQVVQRLVIPKDRTRLVAGHTAHVAHVAVLAGGDGVLVAAELGRVDACRRVVSAPRPLAVGPLDRNHPVRVGVGRPLVERVRHVLFARDAGERRIAHVVADAAGLGLLVERCVEELVVGIGVRERPTFGVVVVDDEHAVTEEAGDRVDRREVTLVLRVGAGRVVGIARIRIRPERRRPHHAVAGVAAHALAVLRLEGGSIRRRRASFQPALWRMAADAEISTPGRVLLGNCHPREEELVACGVRHHAAAPGERRLDGRIVPAVAVVTLVAGFEGSGLTRLGAGHEEIFERGRGRDEYGQAAGLGGDRKGSEE